MFGGGWTEMLIIGIVALVVIGPKDLPVVMRKLGKAVGTVRRMGEEFQRELNKTTGLDQLTDLRRSIAEPLRQSTDEIMREFNRQTATGFEPSGAIKPPDPNVESVYDQIKANAGMTSETDAGLEPPPGPPEAKPKASRRRKPAVTKATASKPPSAATKPAKTRTSRSKAAKSAAATLPVVKKSAEAGVEKPTVAARRPRKPAATKSSNVAETPDSPKPTRSRARASKTT